MGLWNWLHKPKKEQPDEGISYSSGKTFIRVDGKEYPIRIDSIEVHKKAAEMQQQLVNIQQSAQKDPAGAENVVGLVRDFVLMMTGPGGYSGIFDTPEKRDSWDWHLEVFNAIFAKTIEFKMQEFQSIVTAPALKQLQGIQAKMNRKQRRALRKHV